MNNKTYKLEGEMPMTKNKYRQELLIKLLQINSISGEEWEVANIVMQELLDMGFDVEQDKLGNVYAVRGYSKKYPLLNAHMDIVELWDSKSWNSYTGSYSTTKNEKDYYDYIAEYDEQKDEWNPSEGYKKSCTNCYYREYCDVLNEDEFVCSAYRGLSTVMGYESNEDENNSYYQIDVSKSGIISGSGEYRVLGGDDKCGLFIALEVARTTKQPMKILFTVQEEIGVVGMDFVAETRESWFDDIAYSITIDRRGGNQLLTSQLGTKSCSKDFAKMCFNAGKSAGIEVQIEDGSVADVIIIRDLVDNAVNISAGYYSPHTEFEVIDYVEVEQIIKWVTYILRSNKRYSRKRYYDTDKLKKELGIYKPTVIIGGSQSAKKY